MKINFSLIIKFGRIYKEGWDEKDNFSVEENNYFNEFLTNRNVRILYQTFTSVEMENGLKNLFIITQPINPHDYFSSFW